MDVLTFSVTHNVYIKKELKINTVTLSHNNNEKVGLFRCIYCGEAIKQYMGDVVKIVPWAEPTAEVLTIDQCHNCHSLFNFQTNDKKQNKETEIVLSCYPPYKNAYFFFCYVCRNPILRYGDFGIGNIQIGLPVELPYHYKCNNHSCHANYFYREVI